MESNKENFDSLTSALFHRRLEWEELPKYIGKAVWIEKNMESVICKTCEDEDCDKCLGDNKIVYGYGIITSRIIHAEYDEYAVLFDNRRDDIVILDIDVKGLMYISKDAYDLKKYSIYQYAPISVDEEE